MKLHALILVCAAPALLGLEPFGPPAHAAETATVAQAPAGTKSLQQFMEKELNPAFTDVSYLLFQVRKPGEKPSAELHSAFERLLEKSSQLSRLAQGRVEASSSLRHHAVQFEAAVRGLAEASQSGDEARIDAWMAHVTSACQSCHTQ